MAGSVNKVILVGNVGRDPEIRTTNDGKELASFSIATSETWKDKATGEKKDKTEWHRVVIFSEGLVNIVKNYVKKGSKIYVEGQLQTRKWTDNNGQERYSTEIVLQGYNATLTLLDSKNDSNTYNTTSSGVNGAHNNSFGKSQNNSKSFDNSELDDEIPF